MNTGIPLYSVITSCRGCCAASDFSNDTGSSRAGRIRRDSFLRVVAGRHGGVLAALRFLTLLRSFTCTLAFL